MCEKTFFIQLLLQSLHIKHTRAAHMQESFRNKRQSGLKLSFILSFFFFFLPEEMKVPTAIKPCEHINNYCGKEIWLQYHPVSLSVYVLYMSEHVTVPRNNINQNNC